MKVGRHEVAVAKTLKAAGFPWRPRVGDWFIDHTGHCALVANYEQAQALGENGDVFLPTWCDCREWLATRGFLHPEVTDLPVDPTDRHPDMNAVSMKISHANGRQLQVDGVSDLDAIYRLVLMVMLAHEDGKRSRPNSG